MGAFSQTIASTTSKRLDITDVETNGTMNFCAFAYNSVWRNRP